MKKLIILMLTLLVPLGACAKKTYLDIQLDEVKKSQQYNTVNKFKGNSQQLNLDTDISTKQASLVKDPGLIHIPTAEPVDEEKYASKLAKDEETYKKVKSRFSQRNFDGTGVNYYRVYRIAERIIRANNLDYVNWRIAIRKTPVHNASASEGNFILVNTGMYDTLGDNDDALAWVLAHEMSHLILGHISRSKDLRASYEYNKRVYRGMRASAGKDIIATKINIQENNILKAERHMEYMADSEGLNLIIKAGYSPEKAIEAVNLLNALSGNYDFGGDHPHAVYRLNNFRDTLMIANPNWVNIGRENIYNGEVLPCKMGSDRVSVIIPKAKKPKVSYQLETPEERIIRMAYVTYKKGYLGSAKNYFKKWIELDPGNYVPYLYLSYANEVNYKAFNNSKFLRRAQKAVKKAYKYAPYSLDVQAQMKDLEKL